MFINVNILKLNENRNCNQGMEEKVNTLQAKVNRAALVNMKCDSDS